VTGEISKLGWSLPWSAKIQPGWRRWPTRRR